MLLLCAWLCAIAFGYRDAGKTKCPRNAAIATLLGGLLMSKRMIAAFAALAVSAGAAAAQEVKVG